MQSENQQIDLILSKITLSPPKKAFDFFVEGKDVQSKNKLSKQEIETYTIEYDCLSDTEKDSFLTKEKQDQERYDKEIELVEKYLIRPYHRKGITAEQIFIKTFIKAYLNDNNDNKTENELEEIAIKTWDNMLNEEKKEWIHLKKENDILWSKMKNNTELNTYDYFCQLKMKEGLEKGKEIVVTDCDFLWGRLSKQKEKYYALKTDDENKKRKEYKKFMEENNKDELFAANNSDVNATSKSGYDLFLNNISSSQEEGVTDEDLTDDKYFNFFKYASDLWKKLPPLEKQKYMILAHKEQLIYLYRKKLYEEEQQKSKEINEFISSEDNPNVTGFDVYFQKQKNSSVKIPEGQTPKKYYANIYQNLNESEKEFYSKIANEINVNTNDNLIKITPQKDKKTGINVFFEEVRFLLKQSSLNKNQKEETNPNISINDEPLQTEKLVNKSDINSNNNNSQIDENNTKKIAQQDVAKLNGSISLTKKKLINKKPITKKSS